LLTAQQFERAIGEIGWRLIHRATLAAGGGTHLPKLSRIRTGLRGPSMRRFATGCTRGAILASYHARYPD
jgi:hypothetical protein